MLENKRFFTRQVFVLSERNLQVFKRGLLDTVEFEISLEDIHNKKRIETSTNNNFLFLFFALSLVGILFMISLSMDFGWLLLSLGIVFLIAALTTRRKVILITTDNNYTIELFYRNRNKDEILDFANAIIAASNNFLYKKYGSVDRSLPIEGQLYNLGFLRDREVITNEEFEQLKDQLLGRNIKSTVGFTNHQ